ncbi:MAG: tRNA (adenosine(37)-N6)-threonylcarbamoyltransferase complex transferase subunit TsaD [Candidatus Omnitrophica bacterium]|nr:tRNA (adenosine(37)-N6)-threonylcarbamoyltransferase complex transferase subunit TsaD [Candidatus Omnitrophota bacterium]MBU4488030.1 tRNA (adenosine(37)-N6)-threonylcarbamoyltransferase complex transferase subunit TsaD [Candidatus Omnitrophota bacterium]MCG2704728.1 tRNA (adenosine(37)-N6)-threonylcarbamoyltransferase complex transferase subunit TsaD [Candidatus Omnitrophota bacterium]
MIVLGIETSCDETAVAVLKDNTILSNSVSSSIDLHKDFGGVIPEIACRYHVEYINYVLRDALKAAGKTLKDVDLIAVTVKPGLVGALLVGVSLAKALALSLDVPIIGVDHLIAHLYAPCVSGENVKFPFVGMVVSGGHTNLFLVRSVTKYKLLGQTLDDAAGEAFDKVAKLLGLGYPGGPVIQKMAAKGRVDKKLFSLESFDGSLNFSFSGIKTAVLYHLRDRLKKGKLAAKEINDIAASFQDAVTDILTKKAILACERERVYTLVLGGGVTANEELRRKIAGATQYSGIKLYLPLKKLCLDNAAMVAGLGGALYKRRVISDLGISAESSSIYAA